MIPPSVSWSGLAVRLLSEPRRFHSLLLLSFLFKTCGLWTLLMKLYSQWLLSLLIFVYNQFDGDSITLGIVLPPPPPLSEDNSVLKTSGEGTCLTVRMVKHGVLRLAFKKQQAYDTAMLFPCWSTLLGHNRLNEAYTAKTWTGPTLLKHEQGLRC